MTHCEPIAVHFKSPNKATLQNKVQRRQPRCAQCSRRLNNLTCSVVKWRLCPRFYQEIFLSLHTPLRGHNNIPPLSPHLTFVPVQSQPATKLLPATHLQAVSRNGAVQAWSQCLKYTTTCQNSTFTTSCASPLRCLHQVMTSSSSSFLFDFLVALMTSGVRGQKDWRDHWKAAITCGDHQGLY